MFRKVNARERIVGWYSTGPKIKPNDLSIHQVFECIVVSIDCFIVGVSTFVVHQQNHFFRQFFLYLFQD